MTPYECINITLLLKALNKPFSVHIMVYLYHIYIIIYIMVISPLWPHIFQPVNTASFLLNVKQFVQYNSFIFAPLYSCFVSYCYVLYFTVNIMPLSQ